MVDYYSSPHYDPEEWKPPPPHTRTVDKCSYPVYSPLEIDFLELHGSTSAGFRKRKVPIAFLAPPSATNSLEAHVPSILAERYGSGQAARETDSQWVLLNRPLPSPTDSDESTIRTIDVPNFMESPEAIEFFGFTRQRALELWEHYLVTIDHVFNEGLTSLLIENVDSIPSNLDWEATFDKTGIRAELRDAIMNPKYATVRDTEGPKFWITETIRDREQLLENATAYVKMHRDAPSAPCAPQDADDCSCCIKKQKPGPPPQTASATTDMKGDHVTLWKGVGIHRKGNVITRNGHTNILDLTTSRRSDFSYSSALCLTPTREDAVMYANYAWHRNYETPELPALVRFRMSNECIQKLTCREIWTDSPNDIWRKVVWNCRARRGSRAAIRDETRYDLLKGHVSRGPKQVWDGIYDFTAVGIDQHQAFSEFSEVDGQRRAAIQWVFTGEKMGLESLEELLQGRVFIESAAVL